MKRFDSINVIPFIDIMLVLLAIVLTTATFIAQGKIDINLPKANQEAAPPQDPPITLAIDRDGAAYYNDEAVTLEELSLRLSGLDKETPIVMRVDEAVPFAGFVSVVDILKTQKLERLSIVTQRPQ
jgi:biopolymer transport protein ExbD